MTPRSSLKVLGGPLDGRELVLPDDAVEVLVGRDASCQLRLELPGVSAIHARLRRDAGGATTVFEAGSPGPIYVNDDIVRGRAALRNGDILWLGAPGEPGSLMIQCRLAPLLAPQVVPPPAAPAPAAVDAGRPAAAVAAATAPADEAADEAFFIADSANPEPGTEAPGRDGTVHVEEFLVTPEASPAADAQETFFFEEPAPAQEAIAAEEFFIAEPEAPAPPAPPSSALPPAAPASPVPQAPLLPQASPVPPAAQAAPTGSAASPARSAPGRPSAARPASPPAGARRPVAAGAVRAQASAAPRPRPPAAARRAGASAGSTARRVALAAAALVVLAGGGFAALRVLRAPRLDAVSPSRAKVGQFVTLAGSHFAPNRDGNRVLFGDRVGSVTQASATQIQVEVPELPTAAGSDLAVQVRVEAGGRTTGAVELAVYQAPRIHGLSPDVGMPGSELTLAGSGWGPGASVHFGPLAAELLMTSATALRVRVPPLDAAPGTTVPVSVSIGGETSNEAPFTIGRLPLLQEVAPGSAAPGDLVTLRGRGFHADPQRNAVAIGGTRALVVGSSGGELQVMVPFAPAGAATLELGVPGSDEPARAVLEVAPPADPVDWRFVAEPFEDAAGHAHAVVSTALGPAFVLSAAGGRTAAERAAEAARRLNDAAAPLRASLDAGFRARGSAVMLVPREVPALEATAEDAAGYGENWTRAAPRGAVAPERLAEWWTAIARDLVLLLLRNERPAHAAGIGAEGRVLGDVYQAGRRTGRFGLARQVLAELKPAQREALRVMAQRVPAGLLQPALAASAPGGAAGGAAPLRLQGQWTGFESAESSRKRISVSFGRSGGGTLTFTEGVSIGVPLLSAETPQRNSVRFSAQVRGGVRYYLGTWNGETLSGRITTDPGGRNAVGTFELTPGI